MTTSPENPFKHIDPISLFSGSLASSPSRLAEIDLPLIPYFFEVGQNVLSKFSRRKKYQMPLTNSESLTTDTHPHVAKLDVNALAIYTTNLVEQGLTKNQHAFQAYRSGEGYSPIIYWQALRSIVAVLDKLDVQVPFNVDDLDLYAALALLHLDAAAGHMLANNWPEAISRFGLAVEASTRIDQFMVNPHGRLVELTIDTENSDQARTGAIARRDLLFKPIKEYALSLYEAGRWPSMCDAAKRIAPIVQDWAQPRYNILRGTPTFNTVYRWIRRSKKPQP